MRVQQHIFALLNENANVYLVAEPYLKALNISKCLN